MILDKYKYGIINYYFYQKKCMRKEEKTNVVNQNYSYGITIKISWYNTQQKIVTINLSQRTIQKKWICILKCI